jgi:endonuclease YncB( thermonuclease family)
MFPKYNFPLQDYTVIDGDTIAVVLDMGWDVSINQSCRLLGIDAPEKSTAAGKAVKQVVINKLAEEKDITVESVERDKYAGRFVGRVWLGNESLNQWLLDNQLVRAYDGGKKQLWALEDLDAISHRCLVMLSADPKIVASL